jgi:magnesium transporter
MLAMFQRGQRRQATLDPATGALPEDAVWLDMHEPTAGEIGFVRRSLGIDMPTREEMREIEASARVYEEDGGLFLTATVLVNADMPPPATTEITFILKGERLVTLRYADPQPFRTMPVRLERHGSGLASGQGVFFWLADLIVARIADVLERASLDIDTLSGEIFGAANAKPKGERPDLLRAIERIGRSGDTAARARESLLTIARILLSVGTSEILPPGPKKEARARAKALNRDVASLTDHAAFLTGKISLLLDATLGMINIEQNAIIKIFSVVAVIFLPPTLIASIYGMNFDVMPEVHLRFGYPIALALMVASAVVPIVYFKRRGWL